uniref:Uncharacterized protein n=1 Tax=Arundo donax TaxID=35708 RepID=A0A0A9AEL0_ARUDO
MRTLPKLRLSKR